MAEEMEEIIAEPWDPMEAKLIKWTIIAGIISMILLAAVIQMTVLVHYR
jgi:hypothetical protein